MVLPIAAIMVASALASAAAQGGSAYASNQSAKRAAKRRAKESKRETFGGLYNDALQRSAELEEQRLAGSRKLGKRRSQSMHETSDLVRGALNI